MMADSSAPYTPPNTPRPSNMPLLYYGLAVIGTAAVLLVMYNLIILRWCAYRPAPSREGAAPSVRQLEAGVSSRSYDTPSAHLISSFKYNKEGSSSSKDIGVYNEHECAVCLSVFEQDEELKQLPRCKHSFHAPCIDMWLYSHLDCPLCRSPVDPPPFLNRVATTTTTPTRTRPPNSTTSRDGLLDSIAI